MTKRFLAGLLLGFFVIVTASLCAAAPQTGEPDYWPTKEWPTSPPENQGVDSDVLADLIETIRDNGHHFRDLIVIRNGYLVLDARFHPFPEDSRHIIHSCTKTMMGTLIGIA
ncbi:MAG: 6-aminohexanoate hydrolase, partial [Candidatus Latescibacterota bacterium]